MHLKRLMCTIAGDIIAPNIEMNQRTVKSDSSIQQFLKSIISKIVTPYIQMTKLVISCKNLSNNGGGSLT
jgi:hypothetical protein